jgi:hypothetical protein
VRAFSAVTSIERAGLMSVLGRWAPTCAFLLAPNLLLAAQIVYSKVGLRILRTAWFDLDWLWADALALTGEVVLFT